MSVPAGGLPVGFVLQLELKRLELGLGHGAWAEYLGIDRADWYLLRQGKQPLSWTLMRRVLLEWPEAFEPLVAGAIRARPPRRRRGGSS